MIAADDIIDGHVHLWPSMSDDYPRVPGMAGAVAPDTFTESDLFAVGAALGIARTVAVQHIGFYGYDNRYLIDRRAEMPDRIAVIGAVGEAEPDGPERLQTLAAAGAQGIRVRGFDVEAWPGDPNVLALWETAEQLGLAVCPLLRARAGFEDEPLPSIATLAERFSELTVIIDHMAFIDPRDARMRATLIGLSRHPNVLVKVSGFEKHLGNQHQSLAGFIKDLIEAFGAERLMWGSDMPLLKERGGDLAQMLTFMRQDLTLRPQELSQILRGTAERIFFALSSS